MKNARFKVTGYVLMVGLLIIAGLSKAEASDYLGEFCWNLSVGGQVEGKLRLAVTDMGDRHYIVNGTSTDPADSGVAVTHGNAEIVGNEVILTLNDSQSDQTTYWDITTWNIRLNMPSLNGTFRAISTNHDNKGFYPLEYGEGAVTIIPCR